MPRPSPPSPPVVFTEAQAEEARKLLEQELLLQDLGLKQPTTETPRLQAYWLTFERSYVSCLKPTSQGVYEDAFRKHILPRLGHKTLGRLTRADVEGLIDHLVEEDYSQSSIRIIISALRSLLSHAIEAELIDRNVASGTSKLYRNARRPKKIQPLSHEESQAFLKAATEYCPEYCELFLMALHTGMRSGELEGLQWEDIDFNGKFVMVRRQKVWGRVQPTKTSSSRRIDLSSPLVDALKQLKLRRKEQWLAKGQAEIPPWVFLSVRGKPVAMYDVKRRQFRKCLEKAGLRRIRFHDLRHTFATLPIQNGEPIAYVQKQLGHSSIQMTVDCYTHWLPGENREAMDRLPGLDATVL